MLPIGLPIGETPDFYCSNRPVALVMPTPPGHEVCQVKRMKVKWFS